MTTTGTAFRPGHLDQRLLKAAEASRPSVAIALSALAIQMIALVVQALALATLLSSIVLSKRSPAETPQPLIAFLVATLIGVLSLAVSQRFLGRAADQTVDALADDVLSQLAGGVGIESERAGGIAIALTSGLDNLQAYFGRYVPALLQTLLLPPLLLVVIALLDPWSALLLLVGLVALPPILSTVGRRGAAAAGRQWRTLHALSSRYAELLDGLATIRLLRQEAAARQEIEAATQSFGSATIAALRVAFRSSLVAEFMAGAAVGLTAMLLGFRLLAGQVPLSHALAILLLAGEVYAPLRRVNAEFHAASSGREAASMLFALIDQPAPHIVGGATLSNGVLVLDRFTALLVAGEVLEPLSNELGRGVGLHLTGPSGIGKTTVLEALARSLGNSAALAPQHPYLFSGTLFDNLVLSNPDVERGVLSDLITRCQLDRLIEALPDGLQTSIGDGGLQLSSGERQRIGLARALVAQRPVLLLDEVGSHLDPETLEALRHALKPLFSEAIVIEVAHSHGVVDCALREEIRRAS